MASKKANLTAVTVGAAGLLLAGGGAIAYAASSNATTRSPSASTASGSASNGTEGGTTGKPGGRGGMGGHAHTPVTGAELTKVTDAIKAKDAAVTVTSVVKDEDGSYDAFGTKDGAPVRVEASADLKTITVETGMGRGPGGRGHHGMGDDHGMDGQPGQSGTGQGGVTDPRLPSSTPSATN